MHRASQHLRRVMIFVIVMNVLYGVTRWTIGMFGFPII